MPKFELLKIQDQNEKISPGPAAAIGYKRQWTSVCSILRWPSIGTAAAWTQESAGQHTWLVPTAGRLTWLFPSGKAVQ